MRKTIVCLISIGLAMVLAGFLFGLQTELIEKIYQNPGDPGPSTTTISIYPNALSAIIVITLGAIIEFAACFILILDNFNKEELEKTSQIASTEQR